MEADEDGIGDAVGDADAFAERDEGVACPGHLDLEPFGFEFFFEPVCEVEGEDFFFSKGTAGAAVVAAVSGVDDHGVKIDRVLDVARAEDGIDEFDEVEPGDEDFPVLFGDRVAEDEADVVDEDILASEARFEDDFGRAEPDVAVFFRPRLEAVEPVDAIGGEVVPILVLDDFPGGAAFGGGWSDAGEEDEEEGGGGQGARLAKFGNGVRSRMCSHDPRGGKIHHTGTVGVEQVEGVTVAGIRDFKIQKRRRMGSCRSGRFWEDRLWRWVLLCSHCCLPPVIQTRRVVCREPVLVFGSLIFGSRCFFP